MPRNPVSRVSYFKLLPQGENRTSFWTLWLENLEWWTVLKLSRMVQNPVTF